MDRLGVLGCADGVVSARRTDDACVKNTPAARTRKIWCCAPAQWGVVELNRSPTPCYNDQQIFDNRKRRMEYTRLRAAGQTNITQRTKAPGKSQPVAARQSPDKSRANETRQPQRYMVVLKSPFLRSGDWAFQSTRSVRWEHAGPAELA